MEGCGLPPQFFGGPDGPIRIEGNCSLLDIQDAPLPVVAKALSWESGVKIRLVPSLMEEFISARLYAKDCSDAVLLLLQDFSMMKFWGDDGALVAVQVLSRKQPWIPEAEPETASVSMVSTQVDTEQLPVSRAEALNNQMQTLIDVAQGKLSPVEVMYNPLYEPYFKKAGLNELEDWQDKKKMKILRRHVTRAWMKQLQASQSR